MIYRTVLLSTLLVSIVAAVHDHRKSSSTFTTAFVSPGAAPTVVRNVHAVASCYGVCSTAPPPPATTTTSTTALCSKKKKKSATAPGKGGKLQVQMLKAIEGTGRVGDVVMVAPAFFENKLRKTNSARLVTDEEVASQKKESSAKAAAKLDSAREVADKITTIKTISFMKKAGPDGHLFGGIKTKDVLTELRLQFPTGTALDDKHVKVQRLRDAEGAAVDHDIIKYLGDFQATIALLDDVSADLTITVTSDKQ